MRHAQDLTHPFDFGFSLLELLTVLSLMMALLSWVTPSLAQQWQRQNQTQAMHQLYTHLHRARLTAVAEHTTVSACPSHSGQRCDAGNRWDAGWIVFFDAEHLGQPQQSDDIIERADKITQAIITSGARQRIRFRAQGTAYGSNGTITLCHPNKPGPLIKIVISNPGRLRWLEDAQLSRCN